MRLRLIKPVLFKKSSILRGPKYEIIQKLNTGCETYATLSLILDEKRKKEEMDAKL